jgi:hypothetical protein
VRVPLDEMFGPIGVDIVIGDARLRCEWRGVPRYNQSGALQDWSA